MLSSGHPLDDLPDLGEKGAPLPLARELAVYSMEIDMDIDLDESQGKSTSESESDPKRLRGVESFAWIGLARSAVAVASRKNFIFKDGEL